MPLPAFLTGGSLLAKLLKGLIDGLYGIFSKERRRINAEKAKALQKANESVEESLEVEKTVRDKQDEVDKPENKSDVEDKDGGLNFDSFNSGEDK